jgi:uridine kinase
VIFVGGLSGSGKTVAASRSGVVPVLPLDSYFEDAHPDLPKWLGRTDWETIKSYDLDGALSAVFALLDGDCVAVPISDHHRNGRVGSRVLTAHGAFVAEGVYAPETYEAVAAAGLPAVLLHIDAPAGTAFCSRLHRRRRPPHESDLGTHPITTTGVSTPPIGERWPPSAPTSCPARAPHNGFSNWLRSLAEPCLGAAQGPARSFRIEP